MQSSKEELAARALEVGIESLEGSYKAVSAAAKDCGIGEMFNVKFKYLSKYAHPTAMQILARGDPEEISLQRDLFFSNGCLFFVGAFNALETAMRKIVEI